MKWKEELLLGLPTGPSGPTFKPYWPILPLLEWIIWGFGPLGNRNGDGETTGR